jgi:hypothetical protein
MSADIPESDWRRFREVHKTLLERYCARVLGEVNALTVSPEGSAHERYLRVYKLIEDHDEEIARAFNDMRRSTATLQLGIMRRMGLLSDDELSGFSERTRERVLAIASL